MDLHPYAGDRGHEIVTYRPPPLYERPPVPKRSSSQVSGSGWGLNDAEMKRRRRVASYKAYAVEGRVKATFRKGFRWIKIKCSELVHGW